MPIIDGYEFAGRAHEMIQVIPESQRPKLVAVSGNVENSFIKRCFECGFDQFFSKPINSDYIAILALEQNLQVEVRQSVKDILE